MKFGGIGFFKHKYEDPKRIPNFEERIILVEASSLEEAEKIILKEFRKYGSGEIEFLEEYGVTQAWEGATPNALEVYSIMRLSTQTSDEFISNFWSDERPDSCDSVGWQHAWYNKDNEQSACYNCREIRKGQLWKVKNKNHVKK